MRYLSVALVTLGLLTACSEAPEHQGHSKDHAQPHAAHNAALTHSNNLVTVNFTNASTGVDISITQPIIRAAFSQATTGAAYVSLQNHSQNPVTLESVTTAGSLVDEVQLHDIVMDGETMKMEQIMTGIEIAPDSVVALQPGGQHIMLMGLNDTLDAGKTFPLTLNFGESGSISVDFTVVKL